MLELRQVILILREHLVDHVLDFLQRQHSGGQRVVADGAVDHGRVAEQAGSDRHFFNLRTDIGQDGALGGQRADMDGMNAVSIHQHRDFHAGAQRQVGDEIRVQHVAIEFVHFSAHQSVDDICRVFMSTVKHNGRLGSEPFLYFFLPRILAAAIFLQNVGILARVPARARIAILFDQVGALAEPPVIFRVVPARLGDIFSEREIHLVADNLHVVDFFACGNGFMDLRVRVHAVDFEIEIPRLMVNTRAGVGDLIQPCADPPAEHLRRPLHGVAESRRRDKTLALNRAAQHRHRISVVEQGRLRAVFFHVAHDVHHRVDGAQETKNPRRTARVAHVGIHAVFLGDFDIMPPDLCAARKDGRQHHIRAS